MLLRQLVLTGLFLGFGCAAAQKHTELENGNRVGAFQVTRNPQQLVDAMINEFMQLPTTPPGLGLAVGKHDSICYAKGYGVSDLNAAQAVDTTTQFRWGSGSRLATISALLQLMELGKLDFKDKLSEVLPSYPQKEHPISIRQLAVGLSGMDNHVLDDLSDQTHFKSVDEALAVFEQLPLDREPGESYRFSLQNFTVLAKVMEEVSGKSFPEVLQQYVFNPLDMAGASIENIHALGPQMSQLFEFNPNIDFEGGFRKIGRPKDYSYSWAGAGLRASPIDLVKLGQAYHNGTIAERWLSAIFQIQTLSSGDTIRQSIGWDKNWDMANRRVFEQDGVAQGARNIISVFPDQQFTLAIMANATNLRAIEETAHTLAIPFLTRPAPIKQRKGRFKLNLFEDVRGAWVKREAVLNLSGATGCLQIAPGTANEECYSLMYLERGNQYALFHPDGILYTEINVGSEGLSGRVMYYRGPNLHKTSTEPPYLRFNGKSG